MADSTSKSAPKINEETAERRLNELINVDSHDEYENRLSRISSALANWMKSVFNMDTTTKEEFDPVWLSIDEYKSQANESMANAWRIITLPNWTVEKRGTVRGDVVESRKVEGFGKVYRFTEIGDGVDLSYQVTAGGGRGIITPCDFVILRRTALLSREGRVVDDNPHGYISSGVSVQVPGYPPLKEMVRGHNKVGCWYLQPRTVQTPGGKIEDQALFQWLMCCDLKGKIPQFVLDVAFATVMLDYIVHVRKFVAEAKARAEF
uniref:Carotenoid-binding protein transcript variant 8 n=1 Tax=Bombyx mori TaxID=7091 RepID=X2F4T0_BOMMO|nr:carotenoid-binding protein transcript variant 8 [Bombyx mori]